MAVIEVARGVWVGGLVVPVLPDTAGNDEATVELGRGYRALAEAVAMSPVGDCAVQLRFSSEGAVGGVTGVVTCALLLRARTQESCEEWLSLIGATLSSNLVPRTLPPDELWPTIHGPCDLARVCYSEIRRVTDDVGPLFAVAGQGRPDLAAVRRWLPDHEGLRQACTLLARHRTPGMIVLHMEPAAPSESVLEFLDSTIRDIAIEQDVASSPLRNQVVIQNRMRLRDLPRAALAVRVVMVGTDHPSPTVAAAAGIALTDEGGFEVGRPMDDRAVIEYRDFVGLLASRRLPREPVDELALLCDTREAAGILRFPVPAPAGTPGLSSAPVPILPRSAEARRAGTRPVLALGVGAGGGAVDLAVDELVQHAVVAGLPGFGKTLTTQTLLAGLAGHGVPFLVIDPAKSDYRELAAVVPDLRVIALSPDIPAFNPFALPEGCARVTFAGRVLAAFDAAFSLSRDWPAGYVTFARAIYQAYEVEPEPTLALVRDHLEDVLRRSRFAGPDGANLRASLLGRLEFLARGPLGAAIAAPVGAGADWAALTEGPTVIELRQFAAPMERSLVFALLLGGLISYRERHPFPRGLGHVTVLEEAHRLLRRANDGPAVEGVRMFVEAIAELRGSGEGFMVVDQAPSLLDPGVMKLAGSMISHRLVDPDERAIMGAAMLLTQDQSADLARLETGEVVVHSPTRRGSIVTRVRPPDQLLRAADGGGGRSTVSGTLPWVSPGPPGPDGDLGERVRRLAGSLGVVGVFEELASELVYAGMEPAQHRSRLAAVSHAIRQEISRRKQEEAQP